MRQCVSSQEPSDRRCRGGICLSLRCPEALLNAIRVGTAECLIECYPRRITGPIVEPTRTLLIRFASAEVKVSAVG
ncbi:hypothetical protein SAMN05421755_11332 [Nitrosomonas sp. Nm33]|nr:hypothetical protein SAMN05421755_11332 [Nitrosomonas sp. Nm33]